MHIIDWTIIVVFIGFATMIALHTRKYSHSVADFLAANRCAGRYVICVSEGMVALSAVGVVAMFEVYYNNGFPAAWWNIIQMLVPVVIALSGWIIYRYRQTRALTMAQFFEMRYSRKFRICAGILCWFSGILNFGIFPAVGARFFLQFCGLPESFSLLGVAVPTLAPVMLVLLALALTFTFSGGQVTVVVSDFFQGIFCNIFFLIVIVVVFVRVFSWSQITEALAMAPPDASMLHPFQTSKAEGFTIWFFLIWAFIMFYNAMAWQGSQGMNACGRTPHEARMGRILGIWRQAAMQLLWVFFPICAYTLMHHPNFVDQAANVKVVLAGIENKTIQTQMTSTVALTQFLGKGLMGIFAAVMVSAFVTTNNACLHSWGSIFIQDVILPLRKKPFAPEQHIKILRCSILFVAVFAFFWSLFFPQNDYIFMYWNLTGAIFVGGAGSAIIGGLYWKRGATAGAWAALLTGSILGVSGVAIRLVYKRKGLEFPVDGTQMAFLTSMVCIVLYVVISLCKRTEFNMDRLLHRGQYAVADDLATGSDEQPMRGFKALGMSREFTRGDKIIYLSTIAWVAFWAVIFVFGIIYNVFVDVQPQAWAGFWHWYIWFYLVVGIATTIWLTIGGLIDVRAMFRLLRARIRDDRDDGTVVDGRLQAEP